MIELRSGDAALSIDSDRGGRWASLRIRGQEVLVGPPDAVDRSFYWGCFLMAPWAGRIANGRLSWAGAALHLRANDGQHAIHGLVFDRPWRADVVDESAADLSCDLAGDGWSLGGCVRQVVVLSPGGLTARVTLVAGDLPMPAALGWHPWFVAGSPEVRVRVDGAEVLETAGLIPTGNRLPVDELTDLRAGVPIQSRRLDHVYPGAASPAVIAWPGLELSIAFEAPVAALVVHSRPGSFCVEPQTAWPDAPALEERGVEGTGLVRLAPGQCLAASMRWSWRELP